MFVLSSLYIYKYITYLYSQYSLVADVYSNLMQVQFLW